MSTEDKPKRIEPQNHRGGPWVVFGAEEYRVPSLTFRALQELAQDIESLKTIGSVPTPEHMTTIERIVHSALRRNYPQLTQEQVAEMIDVGNFERVLSACLSIAGLQRVEREHPSGEAMASTGAMSIAA